VQKGDERDDDPATVAPAADQVEERDDLQRTAYGTPWISRTIVIDRPAIRLITMLPVT